VGSHCEWWETGFGEESGYVGEENDCEVVETEREVWTSYCVVVAYGSVSLAVKT
jgi:hypothetical protein